jgi:hypothetical protein
MPILVPLCAPGHMIRLTDPRENIHLPLRGPASLARCQSRERSQLLSLRGLVFPIRSLRHNGSLTGRLSSLGTASLQPHSVIPGSVIGIPTFVLPSIIAAGPAF